MRNVLPHSWASTNPQLLMVQPLYFHGHSPTPLLLPRESGKSPLQLQYHGRSCCLSKLCLVLLQLYHCLLLITLGTPAIHFPVRFRILPDPI